MRYRIPIIVLSIGLFLVGCADSMSSNSSSDSTDGPTESTSESSLPGGEATFQREQGKSDSLGARQIKPFQIDDHFVQKKELYEQTATIREDEVTEQRVVIRGRLHKFQPSRDNAGKIHIDISPDGILAGAQQAMGFFLYARERGSNGDWKQVMLPPPADPDTKNSDTANAKRFIFGELTIDVSSLKIEGDALFSTDWRFFTFAEKVKVENRIAGDLFKNPHKYDWAVFPIPVNSHPPILSSITGDWNYELEVRCAYSYFGGGEACVR
jgi:hypothetical protein